MASGKESGCLLSESVSGADYLGESLFAEAIAESIHQTKTSITIGIYAKWGSGKTFLIQHVKAILQRFEKQAAVEQQNSTPSPPAPKSSKPPFKNSKLCLWILCLVFVLGIVGVSLTLASDPRTLLPFLREGVNFTIQSDWLNLSIPVGPLPQKETDDILIKMRTVGIILVFVDIVLIFLIGYCGKKCVNTHHDRLQILWYGAFTKIPVPKSTNPVDRPPAPVDTYQSNSVENGVTIPTTEDKYTRRYIFVDFNAWEYAGSDTLWAAIVSNISDAIEKEFGKVATRMFRTMDVKQIPNRPGGKHDKTLFLQFTFSSTREQIWNMLERYGVITALDAIEYGRSVPIPKTRWWIVKYASDDEYKTAKDSLKTEGVYFETQHPFENSHAPGSIPEKSPTNGPDNSKTSTGKGLCSGRFCQHFSKHPITIWKIPKLFWWILLLVCCLLLPALAYIIGSSLKLSIAKSTRRVPLFVQVLLWLPGAIPVILIAAKVAWAMCHSQRKRIHKALDGTQGRVASQLGFMRKVRNEVKAMVKLIRCAGYIYQKDYRIVIIVDELDQDDLKKVHTVLEAVSVLLSDKSSPFVCLIAADPRIVVKCVEKSLGEAMKDAHVNGREYLKKIINLPVCLPEISELNKRKYVAGLMDQSDAILDHKRSVPQNCLQPESVSYSGEITPTAPDISCLPSYYDTAIHFDQAGLDIGHERFLHEARNFLYNNKEVQGHLQGNARNIKRIFNVITMTACVINGIVKKQVRQNFIQNNVIGGCYHAPTAEGLQEIVRTRDLAENIVLWIILTDQWPYRTSYIIQVIEDAEQRADAGLETEEIPVEWTILEIYQNKVESAFENPDEDLLTLDGDPDLFQTYVLLLASRNFRKEDIMFLLKLTINLDYSIRRSIAFRLKPPPLRKNTDTENAINLPEGQSTYHPTNVVETKAEIVESNGHVPEFESKQ